jgi:hypothetical protein
MIGLSTRTSDGAAEGKGTGTAVTFLVLGRIVMAEENIMVGEAEIICSLVGLVLGNIDGNCDGSGGTCLIPITSNVYSKGSVPVTAWKFLMVTFDDLI